MSSERNRLSSKRNDLHAELVYLQQQQRDATERLAHLKEDAEHVRANRKMFAHGACMLEFREKPLEFKDERFAR